MPGTGILGDHAVAVDPASGEIYGLNNPIDRFRPDGTPDGTEAYVATWGGISSPPPGYISYEPTSLTVGGNGTLYVLDDGQVWSGSAWVPSSTDTVREYAPSGTEIGAISVPGVTRTGIAAFSPPSIAADSQGNVYVALPSGDVEKLAADGSLLWSAALDTHAIAVYGSTLYAELWSSSPAEQASIETYDLGGNPQQSFGVDPNLAVPSPTGFGASSLSVGPAGVAAVATDHRIAVLGADGTGEATWGALGAEDYTASQVIPSPDGSVYVLDQRHLRVVRYDPMGQPSSFATVGDPAVAYWPLTSGAVAPNGDLILYSGNATLNVDDALITLDSAGNIMRTTRISPPAGWNYGDLGRQIALDPGGNVWVAYGDQLDKFDPVTGATLTTWPINAQKVATDSAGNVYVAVNNPPTALNIIQKYSPAGTLLWQWLPDGNPTQAPVDSIALDAEGRIDIFSAYSVTMYDQTGRALADWRVDGGPVTVGSNGDVYAISTDTGLVERYSDFLDPLPPPPGAGSITPPLQGIPIPPPSTFDIAATLRITNRAVTVRLSCVGAGRVPCSGAATIAYTTSARKHAHRASVRSLGSSRLSIAEGRSRDTTIKLNKLARRLLSSKRTLPVTLLATTATKTTTRHLTLRERQPTRAARRSP